MPLVCSRGQDGVALSNCASFAMACACFLPSCSTCFGGSGASAVESEEEFEVPTSSDVEQEDPAGVGSSRGPAGIDAARPQCMCFMPGCVSCHGGTSAAATCPEARKRKRKRKRRQKRELPPGHSKCSLREELEIDTRRHQGSRGHLAGHAERVAALTVAFLLAMQPNLSALEMIGRPRGERWDFFEVYAGVAHFTAAVFALGMVVGPAVDIKHRIGGLKLDCLLESSQALLQAVLAEARPRWLHVAPPCTFWCAMGRWTAHGTTERWNAKRESARTHFRFALHLLSLQEARGDSGSLEQPPGCASWKLGMTRDFRQAYSGWTWCKFPSCAYGMKNPGTGEPWEKMQAFLSNTSLASMRRPCTCVVKTAHVQGCVQGGTRHGERCSTVAGEYPPDMCSALAVIVQKVVRGQ